MKKIFLALAFIMSAAVTAQAGTKFCQDNGGYGELTIDGANIKITTKGIGGEDGDLNFVKMKKSNLDAQWVGLYSDFLRVPVASGLVFQGKLVADNGEKYPAQIYLLQTEKDTKGRIQNVLMVSLGGSPPSPIGVDVSCK